MNDSTPAQARALAKARESLRERQVFDVGDSGHLATRPTPCEAALQDIQWRRKFEPTGTPGVVRRGWWKYEREVEEKRIDMTEDLIRRVDPGPFEVPDYFALLAYQAASIELCWAGSPAAVDAEQRWPRFLLGTVHAPKAYASADVSQYLGFTLILVNLGLVEFMYQAAKAVIAASNPVRSYDGKSDIKTSPTRDAIEVELNRNSEPVERLYRTLEAYYFRGYPRAFANEQVRPESSMPLSLLTAFSERFIMGHEYGHGFAATLESSFIDADNPKHSEEFFADQFGMYYTVLSAQMLDGVYDPAVSLSAMTFALACLSILERTSALLCHGLIADDKGSKDFLPRTLARVRQGVIAGDIGSEKYPPFRIRAQRLVDGYHELFATEFRSDGRGCVATRRSPPAQPANVPDVDPKVRQQVGTGAFIYANALFIIWERVCERLLRDCQQGRRLHPIWDRMCERQPDCQQG